jgi:hypothetical protein
MVTALAANMEGAIRPSRGRIKRAYLRNRLQSSTLAAMDSLTSAVLIFLACSPSSQDCREMRYPDAFASIEECREALPEALRRLSLSGHPATGRCVSSETRPSVDPMMTGSIANDQMASVRVTRMEDGRAVVSTYLVPRSK